MKKLLVPMLWLLSILVFIILACVGKYVNPSPMYRSVVIFVSFNLALTAMLLQTVKNKGKSNNPYVIKMDQDTKENAIKSLYIYKMTFVIVGYIFTFYQFITAIF